MNTNQAIVRPTAWGTFGATFTAHNVDRMTGEMCEACAECAGAAAATARTTGSSEATYTEGEHSAKVRRINAVVLPL